MDPTLLLAGHDHHRHRRWAEAVAEYGAVLRVHPDHAATRVNRADAFRALGRLAEAEADYRRALAVLPGHVAARHGLAALLRDSGRRAEAQAQAEELIHRGGDGADQWNLLGTILRQAGHAVSGRTAFARACRTDPAHATARLNLGLALAQDGLAAEAVAELTQAVAALPHAAAPRVPLVHALLDLGHIDEARAALAPFHPAADSPPPALAATTPAVALAEARLHLVAGDARAGWAAYEGRARTAIPQAAAWDGGDYAGRTLLVLAEANLRETLHMLHYLPAAAARGGTMVLALPPGIAALVRQTAAYATTVALDAPVPAHHLRVALPSLPHLVGPHPRPGPVLTRPPAARLPQPVGTRVKVGLVWAANPTHGDVATQALPLAALEPVLSVAGCALYSLQEPAWVTADLAQTAPGLIAEIGGQLSDWCGLAAALAGLDVLVAADTAVARLAVALGCPVWLMLSANPDPVWGREAATVPWAPSARLFRQTGAGDWDGVARSVAAALAEAVALAPQVNTTSVVDAAFAAADGQPRYRMPVPRAFLADAGVGYLVRHERGHGGFERNTRCFLDAHLRPGDLFVDVGAHWGIMALHAATRWPGEVAVLAIEAAPGNLPHLRRWIAANGQEHAIEVVAAGAHAAPGWARITPQSTMGHAVEAVEAGTPGAVPLVTVDAVLAARPQLAARRVVVKIDVEGAEPAVVAGMRGLLASGRVAAVIWERGRSYDTPEGQASLRTMMAELESHGLRHLCFADEYVAGGLTPYVFGPELCNVFAVSAAVAPRPSYGDAPPPPRPTPDDETAWAESQRLTRQGVALLQQAPQPGAPADPAAAALALFGRALALDMTATGLYNNLGVALRANRRASAAVPLYLRGLALAPDDGNLMSNLGNACRDLGRLDEAVAWHARAMALGPDDAARGYNLSLCLNNHHRPAEALALIDDSLARDGRDPERWWDRALMLLALGDYARGWPAYESRWGLKRSPPRAVAAPLWDGRSLRGGTLFLHAEQGFGDILQFARFATLAAARAEGRVVIEAQPELLRLMRSLPGVDLVVERGKPDPLCDAYYPLLSLPALFAVALADLPTAPYLRPVGPPPLRLRQDGRLKVGVVWAGKPTPRDRSCPLDRLLPLLAHPRIDLYALQLGPRAGDVAALGAGAFLTPLGPHLTDFADSAAMLDQLDLLVTVDTSIAHLAGAMGLPTWVLLLYVSDWRWFDDRPDSPWYPSLRLFRQPRPGDWDTPLAALAATLAARVE